jgi:3-isopropylmalate/(R)-2-methylmalate dehydratase small subunit
MGRVFRFGDNVDTDAIIPARYLVTTDPAELGKHCMEAADPAFVQKVNPGDLIVAGANFGCGSSREHAPVAIKASGIACVIAKSFARIFLRNAINTGLAVLECPEASKALKEGDQAEVDLASGEIRTKSGKTYKARPFPGFIREIMNAGGLMLYVGRRLNERRKGEGN